MKGRGAKYLLSAVAVTALCLPMLWGQGPAGEPGATKAPEFNARLIPDSIAIGDHFTLELTITKDLVQQIIFPEFKDNKLAGEIELLAEGGIDTLSRDGRTITISKKYLLTIFDEGNYSLGQFPLMWVDKNIADTILSKDSLLLKVGTFDVDLENQTIYDIKPPAKAPFLFMEIARWAALYFFVIRPLMAAIVALILFLRRRKRLFGDTSGKKRPGEPPHVTAIRDLEILHNQKLWQNNKHKFYYTRLTDILREYIDGRYGIQAMEMTSEEIMRAVPKDEITGKSYNDLGEVLNTSDLVKFAKYIPEADTNEKSYFEAYYFVENTKPSEIEETPAGETDELEPYE